MDNIDILYKEYIRLHSVVDAYAASSFSDFKLLGAVGIMLAWEPFADRVMKLKSNDKDTTQIVFIGFVAIFFVIAIIASRDLMKQSIIAFEISQIAHYEEAIRNHTEFDLMKTFNMANEWKDWLNNYHGPISNHFRGLLLILAITFPAALLWNKGKKYSFLYIGITGTVVIVYISSASTLIRAINA